MTDHVAEFHESVGYSGGMKSFVRVLAENIAKVKAPAGARHRIAQGRRTRRRSWDVASSPTPAVSEEPRTYIQLTSAACDNHISANRFIKSLLMHQGLR